MIRKHALILTAGTLLAVSLATAGWSAPAATTPDPVRGGKLFLQCAACHTVAPGGLNTVGPNLSGIVGAKAATRPGYAYSPALVKSGRVWDAASLDSFLTRPNQAVPGTKMTFAGVADAKARADLIAYLSTLKTRR